MTRFRSIFPTGSGSSAPAQHIRSDIADGRSSELREFPRDFSGRLVTPCTTGALTYEMGLMAGSLQDVLGEGPEA